MELPENCQLVQVLFLRMISGECNTQWFIFCLFFFYVWSIVIASAIIVLFQWKEEQERRKSEDRWFANFSNLPVQYFSYRKVSYHTSGNFHSILWHFYKKSCYLFHKRKVAVNELHVVLQVTNVLIQKPDQHRCQQKPENIRKRLLALQIPYYHHRRRRSHYPALHHLFQACKWKHSSYHTT